ncbi:MAG TPA: hypothetical protein VE465_21910 [Streptosporangiaceae bacterium]|nr:hypothetical protein [Streptosporangiaceae bacterium]
MSPAQPPGARLVDSQRRDCGEQQERADRLRNYRLDVIRTVGDARLAGTEIHRIAAEGGHDQGRSYQAAGQLRADVGRDLRPWEAADRCERHGHGRVDVRA